MNCIIDCVSSRRLFLYNHHNFGLRQFLSDKWNRALSESLKTVNFYHFAIESIRFCATLKSMMAMAIITTFGGMLFS